jgi:hypothetical protein
MKKKRDDNSTDFLGGVSLGMMFILFMVAKKGFLMIASLILIIGIFFKMVHEENKLKKKKND